MNEKLKDAVITSGGELRMMANWTDRLMEKHAVLREKAIHIADMHIDGKEHLSKYAAQVCKQECDNFIEEFDRWQGHMDKLGIEKKADWGDFAAQTVSGTLNTTLAAIKEIGIPALIAVPAILGVGTSYVWNKMTSPQKRDIGNMQKSVYLNILKAKTARMKRKQALSEEKEKVGDTKKGSTLRI